MGCRLDATREAVAEAEHAVERAEAELAVWECATAVTDAADPRDTAWQQILAERRRAGGPTSGRDTTWPAPARGADEEEVTSAGSGLLAALPADATAEDTEPVVTALDYALICARAGDGVGAGEHLEEARIFAAEAGRRVRLRGEALARAAAQLEFLTTEVPPDVEPRPPAEDIVAPLRKAVEEGRPLGAADHERVRAAVDERLEHLEHHYVRQSAAQLLEALAGGPAEWHETGSGARCITHAPPGWEPDHWIRITVRPDGIGLATHRAGPPSPLDTQRCAEAKQWAADFERAVAHLGLDCDFRFDSDVVAPGTPDDAARFAPGPSGREHERPGPHTRDDRRRRDDRPRHRRIDDRDDRDRRH
ncbi:hypothetical protein GTY57_07500 [Streptomyces sp. SID5475]|nr:hypothetical protein [Streptomyces sp. SID5475]